MVAVHSDGTFSARGVVCPSGPWREGRSGRICGWRLSQSHLRAGLDRPNWPLPVPDRDYGQASTHFLVGWGYHRRYFEKSALFSSHFNFAERS
jgi:hypothetical protein